MAPFDPIDPGLWSFPANLFAAVAWVGLTLLGHRYRRRYRVLVRLGGFGWGLVWIGAVMAAILAESLWPRGLHRSPFFICLLLGMLLTLGLALLRRRPGGWRSTLFRLSHGGLWLVLWAALFGAPDVRELRLAAPEGERVAHAYSVDGRVHPLPFALTLEQLAIDRHPDGQTPRQFRSTLRAADRAGERSLQLEVNAPERIGGYTLYLQSYTADRTGRPTTILMLVRDPWLPLVWIGIALMATGALGTVLGIGRTGKEAKA